MKINEPGMQQLNFSKQYQQGLYSYLSLIRPHVTARHPIAGLSKELYNYQLNQYLSLAAYLTKQLHKFIIIKASPYTEQVAIIQPVCLSNWRYHFIANDFDGLGIDNGFLSINKNKEEPQLLAQISDLLLLSQLPEDSFGDNVSQISLFGLGDNRQDALTIAIQNEQPFVLNDFLQQNEVFINLLVSKAEGYYHTVLIKSLSDVEQSINVFQNVIAPDN